MMEDLVALEGSERRPIHFTHAVAALAEHSLNEVIQVTAVLKPETIEFSLPGLQVYCQDNNLQTTVIAGTSSVQIEGKIQDMEKAFLVQLASVRLASNIEHRVRAGSIFVPAILEPYIVAILGLDNRPAAHPYFQQRAEPNTHRGFTIQQLEQIYNLPRFEGSFGRGQCIAIVELGGGYRDTDLKTFFSGLHPFAPTVLALTVDGATNAPGQDADVEVVLDIEIAGSVCPESIIAVYFAPNTDRGFVDAINAVATDEERKPSVLSISWGAPEDGWTQQALTAMNEAIALCVSKGITVLVASGDAGYSDGEIGKHVDFPASSPYALACGGTTLTAGMNANKEWEIINEVVWGTNTPLGQSAQGAAGGGFSSVFARPTYQPEAVMKHAGSKSGKWRGVPDVAAVADPATGYQIYIDGRHDVIGGTSAVAPLWAGVIALLNNLLNKRIGLVQQSLYRFNQHGFHDITVGNNGYNHANAGWDACTGNGSPNGRELLTAFQAL